MESKLIFEAVKIIVALVTGGFAVKLFELKYHDRKAKREEEKELRLFVDEHLRPLLKAADELHGKLRSLSEQNFSPLYERDPDWTSPRGRDMLSVLYLFGIFWGEIEKIRRDALSMKMSADSRATMLKNFIDCLESRRVRIVERIVQRAIGEVFIPDDKRITFVDFCKKYQDETAVQEWVKPLKLFLARARHRRERQALLQYGIVVHALIDEMDPDHAVTRQRPSWPEKLSRRSWRDLNYRIFGLYLKFVVDRRKYIGPPKRRP